MSTQDDDARVKSAAEIVRTSLVEFLDTFDDLHDLTARVSARASAVWDGNAWVINEDIPYETDYPAYVPVASDEASVDAESDSETTPWQLRLDQRKTGWPLLLDQFWVEIQGFWSSWDNLQAALQPLPHDVEKKLIELRLEVLTRKWNLDLKRKLRPVVGWVEETIGQRTWVARYSKAAAEGRIDSFERLLKRLAASPPAPCDFTDAISEEIANLHDFIEAGFLEESLTKTADEEPPLVDGDLKNGNEKELGITTVEVVGGNSNPLAGKLKAHIQALVCHKWACEEMELDPQDTVDEVSWEYLKDEGLPGAEDDVPQVTQKELWALSTYKQHCSRARSKLKENKNTPRSGGVETASVKRPDPSEARRRID